ncbi:MAG: pirin family protein [Anaeromyxobacteraceae bacterium]
MALPPDAPSPGPDPAVEAVIVPRTRDLGGFEVRRVLPSAVRRMVGPFVFLDQMGPALLAAGQGIDVRPHPHVGLATVTYLFTGELLHRDSLGSVQVIEPGAVNWMTAGRGIAHSERTPPAARARGGPIAGLQLWVALPARDEDAPPSFTHTPAAALPLVEGDGLAARVVLGAFLGARSPVHVFSESLFADVRLAGGARLRLEPALEERAVYVVEGAVEEAGARHEAGRLLVLRPGAEVVLLAAASPARVAVLGGEPLDGPRHLWWNFVATSTERLRAAARAWEEGRFAEVPGEGERVPLPDQALPR